MTEDKCHHCGTPINTTDGDSWAHTHPTTCSHPGPTRDQYGPRWPSPDAPTQLPPDFYDRKAT